MTRASRRSFTRRFVRGGVVWAAAICAWSCGSTNEILINDVASVIVTPNPVTILVGQQRTAQALVRDADGRTLSGAAVVWSVRDDRIVSVSASGVVSALAVGVTEIAANSNGKSGIATITVQRVPVASVAVLPVRVDAIVGSRTTLTAAAYDGDGNALPGRAFVWTSSNGAVATVDAAGVVSAVAPGSATITATTEGKSGTVTFNASLTPVATLAVAPATISISAGQTTRLTATARDAAGNILNGRPVQWSTSNAGVATVSSDGTVTGISDGSATITAIVSDKSAMATVTINSSPVGSVSVLPQGPTITQNATQQLTATVRDVQNVVLTRPVEWTTSDPAIATVTASGLVTGVNAGEVTITATSETKFGTTRVTVVRAAVAAVTVAPATASAVVGQTATFTATVRDARGIALSGRVVTWSSSSNAIATVSATGVATGVAAGTATITATSEGIAGTATLTVARVAVGSVVVAPATASVNVGLTRALTATVGDVNGVVVTDRAVAWTSSATGIATVSSTGVVTGVAAGTANITATSEGRSGTSSITVVVPPVATVAVQPAAATLALGTSATFTAVVRDDGGNVLNGRLVTWSLGDESIIRVTAAGVVTAAGLGTSSITATSEGKSGTGVITVVAIPVATVAIQPSTATVTIGNTTTLTAVARDAAGNVLIGRVITWTTSAPAIATVNAAGTVTGVARGSATITAASEGKTGTATVTVP